jgi:hypothetical protein
VERRASALGGAGAPSQGDGEGWPSPGEKGGGDQEKGKKGAATRVFFVGEQKQRLR